MTTSILVLTALVGGLVGGIAALVIRLITPGQTFLQPPSGLSSPWSQIMTFLTYTSDLILGAIAGLVVLGVGGIDTSDQVKLIATCVVAGLGGSGFLTTLGTKLQAEANTVTFSERFNQATNLLAQTQNVAAAGHEQVQDSLTQGHVPPGIGNQLSDNFAQIQAISESRPAAPSAP
jgi:hypothetical protein